VKDYFAEIPEDAESALEIALLCLTARDRMLVERWYKQGLRGESLGQQAGHDRRNLDYQYCTNIIKKAVAKMRRPDTLRLLAFGQAREQEIENEYAEVARQEAESRGIKFTDLTPDALIKHGLYRSVYISSLNFTPRARNNLERHGILTLHDLLFRPESELLKVRNLGDKGRDEVLDFLQTHNLTMGKDLR
jgi:hypothetical protein